MSMSGIIWIIIVGFVAGLIARFLSPGPNNPSGFILTTVLGIVGAFLATYIGQAIGWYRIDLGGGFDGGRLRRDARVVRRESPRGPPRGPGSGCPARPGPASLVLRAFPP